MRHGVVIAALLAAVAANAGTLYAATVVDGTPSVKTVACDRAHGFGT